MVKDYSIPCVLYICTLKNYKSLQLTLIKLVLCVLAYNWGHPPCIINTLTNLPSRNILHYSCLFFILIFKSPQRPWRCKKVFFVLIVHTFDPLLLGARVSRPTGMPVFQHAPSYNWLTYPTLLYSVTMCTPALYGAVASKVQSYGHEPCCNQKQGEPTGTSHRSKPSFQIKLRESTWWWHILHISNLTSTHQQLVR